MQFTFSCENDKLICASRKQSLNLIRPAHFLNLQSVFREGAVLFDGYSIHFRGEGLPALSRCHCPCALHKSPRPHPLGC